MMVYRQKVGHAYKLRVTDDRGSSVTLSTSTSDRETADAVAAMIRGFRKRRRWDVLNALVARRARLPQVYDAYEQGRLDDLMKDIGTPDLDAMVAEWTEQGANAKYVKQLRRMIPVGIRYPAANFTRKAVSAFLASLKVASPTKNRYRVALSQFARWLVERDVITTNVVRDVQGRPERDPRTVWYEWPDAQRLVDALPEPYRSLEALMAGTGMEWQAIANCRRRDLDLKLRTVRAHGAKTKYRNRLVRITEDWTLPIIAKHASTLTPETPLFAVDKYRALEQHHAAVKRLGLEKSTMHDWRHTYAVNNLQGGMKPAVVKRQLGHAPNSTMVERVYGVWIVDERDYQLTRQAR